MSGIQVAMVLVVFLLVLLVARVSSLPPIGPGRRGRYDDPPLVEDTNPDEIPDDTAPSRSDD